EGHLPFALSLKVGPSIAKAARLYAGLAGPSSPMPQRWHRSGATGLRAGGLVTTLPTSTPNPVGTRSAESFPGHSPATWTFTTLMNPFLLGPGSTRFRRDACRR